MTAKYVTNTFELTDTYKQILLDVKVAGIRIEPSNDNRTKLVFFEDEKQPYEFFVQEDTLTVKLTKRKWYNLFRLGLIPLCPSDGTSHFSRGDGKFLLQQLRQALGEIGFGGVPQGQVCLLAKLLFLAVCAIGLEQIFNLVGNGRQKLGERRGDG